MRKTDMIRLFRDRKLTKAQAEVMEVMLIRTLKDGREFWYSLGPMIDKLKEDGVLPQ